MYLLSFLRRLDDDETPNPVDVRVKKIKKMKKIKRNFIILFKVF